MSLYIDDNVIEITPRKYEEWRKAVEILHYSANHDRK